MKQKLLLIALLLFSFFYNTAKANETEPNNTKAQANTLALNGSNSGKINPAADQDWWKVTTTGDGKLDISLTPLSGKNTWIYLYDNDGTTQLNANYSTGTFTVSTDGLAAGTYYIKVVCYYGTDTGSYNISNALTVPSQSNDAEPNDTKAQAKVLNLNASKTGHIDYYYNNHRDTSDWYKITTTADGRLRLRVTSNNGQYVNCWLFDNDGTTQLNYDNTNGTKDINTDGLAAGTYYVRIQAYYNTGFAPYTIADSLFVPSQANDTEPNGTKAQALTLGLNGSTTGHIAYYYNNQRDTADWYKVTTTADGLLRLRITSHNGQYINCWLYDNDGTTQLNYNNTNSILDINTDGLAAGTYYVRIQSYYNNGFEPYTLADSLFSPSQANDTEPNGTKAQALTLAQDGSTTGHINYYYNNVKDTFDWYKVTTVSDGMLNITITSNNGQNVWAYLFDNDGTLLHNEYTSSILTYHVDGLAAGTYYVRINTYYNSEFAPYTLSNTLTAYTNANDAEPNNYFAQAKTVNANSTTTGHVNFYDNGAKNAVDIFKINYTGSGNMTLVLNQENRFNFGSAEPTWFQVYKDTTASAIYSAYHYSTSGNINLTGLTQGYYYIKIFTYYNGNFTDFSSYSFSNSFTQTNIAKIKLATPVAPTDCSSTNSLKFTCSGSQPPYTIQLYRFGLPYGSPVVVAKTKTFTNLPHGYYYATAYGDGATGTAFGKSKAVTLVPAPTNLSTTNITSTQARFNWTTQSCASYYQVQYRVHDSITWITKKTNGNVGSYIARNLTPGTLYEWRVASADTSNGVGGIGAYTDSIPFTTAASFAAISDNSDDIGIASTNSKGVLAVYPNPAKTQFTLQLNSIKTSGMMSANLKDMNGNVVWSAANINANTNKTVNVSHLANGLYVLQITGSNGSVVASQKIIVSK